MIRIFDSLTHPTLSGTWLSKKLNSGFSDLSQDLTTNNFSGAFAVGIDGVEGYDHEGFYAQCEKYSNLYPVAGINVFANDIQKEIKTIKEIGFVGIKIHPRFSNINIEKTDLSKILIEAQKCGLIVFYCTYLHSNVAFYPTVDPFYSLVGTLKKAPGSKVVLIHGGDVSLLKYAEMVRFNPNLLLDLSLTFLKYEGSSIDLDIRYLFKNFDQRICIGTDHPEYSHKSLRDKFERFTSDIGKSKAMNIGVENIVKFCGLNL